MTVKPIFYPGPNISEFIRIFTLIYAKALSLYESPLDFLLVVKSEISTIINKKRDLYTISTGPEITNRLH